MNSAFHPAKKRVSVYVNVHREEVLNQKFFVMQMGKMGTYPVVKIRYEQVIGCWQVSNTPHN